MTIEETNLLESYEATLNFMGITNLQGSLKDMLELKHFIESKCLITDIQYMESQDAIEQFPELFEDGNQFAKVNLLEEPKLGIEIQDDASMPIGSKLSFVLANDDRWKKARENRNRRFEEEQRQQELDEGSLA